MQTPGYTKPAHSYGTADDDEGWAGEEFTEPNMESAPEATQARAA